MRAVVLERRGRALLRRPRPVRAAASASVAEGMRPFAHRGMPRSTQIQFGRVPVVAVLHGAVVGGGLELAAACHIRVAERSAFYGLPEGQRGIFVGGGGSARIPRLIGVARMTDMMLTGRVYDAEEGQRVGLSQYLVDRGRGPGQGASSWPQRIAAQRAAVQLRGDARAAAHRRHGAGRGPVRRVADGGDRPGRRRRPRSACAPSSKASAAKVQKE